MEFYSSADIAPRKVKTNERRLAGGKISLDSIRLEHSILTGLVVDDLGVEHHDLSFDVYLDGKLSGSGSPIFPRLDSAGGLLARTGAFRIHLPEVRKERQIIAEICASSSKELLARQEFVQLPLLSARGLDAITIMNIHRAPLASVDGFALTEGKLCVTGLALPPGGDPRRVSVKMEDGVTYKLIYPLPHPSARDVYWYWPNSNFSAYRLEIDLARTQHARNTYAFTFNFDGDDVDKNSELKNTFWIPKDLGAYQNYPSQESLRRVQAFDNIAGVTVKGYSDCRRISEIAKRYGLASGGAKVLDWGVGHGRVVRHLHSVDASIRTFGIDIDQEHVAWIRDHLPEISVSHGPLMPPTHYPDDEFDLVHGISVLTHLTHSVQEAWLAEIRRILRPGGMALLTFAGHTAAAFSSRFLEKAWLDEYLATGIGWDLPSNDLRGKISDPNYYRNVNISSTEVITLCKPYFEILDVLECMFGYQDLAVLAKAAREAA